MLCSFILLPFLLSYAYAEGSCRGNRQLSFSTTAVEQKGITFDRIVVNRSVPVQVTYQIDSGDSKISTVSWIHNGQPIKVEEDNSGEVYYQVQHQDASFLVELHISSPTARVTGNWTLIVRTQDQAERKAVCFIGAPPIIHARLGAVRANEGESLAVECTLESSPPSTEIIWKQIYETEAGSRLVPVVNATFKSKDGVKNAIMEWSDATHVTGTYLCTAQSPLGTDNLPIEVRIKGKSAFIWPSVGIALEILVLLVTILVYERHQAKRRKAEEERSLIKAEM